MKLKNLLKSSHPFAGKKQDAHISYDAGYNHRGCLGYYHAGHRTRVAQQHSVADLKSGNQCNDDLSAGEQQWWCKNGSGHITEDDP